MTDVSRMSISEYIRYCRSGESTRDAQREDATKRVSNLVTGTCRTCGNPCIPRPDHLCGYCRRAQRKFDWETCTRCGKRCKWNTSHMCTRCRHRGTRKDSR